MIRGIPHVRLLAILIALVAAVTLMSSLAFATGPTVTVTSSAGEGGVISPSGAQTVEQDSTQTFTITPSDGYVIEDVQLTPEGGEGFTILDQVTFDNNVGTLSLPILGNISINATFKTTTGTKAITVSVGENGSVTPSSTVDVKTGSGQSFTITPADGYLIDQVLLDDVRQPIDPGDDDNAVYTLYNVTADHTLAVTFKALVTHKVQVTCGTGGTITPAPENTWSPWIVVREDKSTEFTVTADATHQIADIVIDGQSALSSVHFESEGVAKFAYSWDGSITCKHQVAVTFKDKGEGTVSITPEAVSTAASYGGTVSPSSAVSITSGAAATFSMQADEGSAISSVEVSTDGGATYEETPWRSTDGQGFNRAGEATVSNVTTNTMLKVTFGAVQTAYTYNNTNEVNIDGLSVNVTETEPGGGAIAGATVRFYMSVSGTPTKKGTYAIKLAGTDVSPKAQTFSTTAGTATNGSYVFSFEMPAANVNDLALTCTTVTPYDLWVNGQQITSDNLSVTCGDGTAVYDPVANKLTLNNATITQSMYIPATPGEINLWNDIDSGFISRMDDLNIRLVGTNTISMDDYQSAGIDCFNSDSTSHNLAFTADKDAKLSITATAPGLEFSGYGIYTYGKVSIDGADISINSACAGLWADSSVSITGSNVDITIADGSTYAGITCGSGAVTIGTSTVDITLPGGTSAGDGILLSDGSKDNVLTMNTGAVVTIKGCSIGINGVLTDWQGNVQSADATIKVNGGRLDVTTVDKTVVNTAAVTNIAEANITFGDGVAIESGSWSGTAVKVVDTAKHLVVTAGAGGTVTGTGWYVTGTKNIAVTATPNAGYAFNGWTENTVGIVADKTAASTTVTMPDADATVTANFVAKTVTRLWGNNALDTMTAITGTGWGKDSCDTVIVATMDGYWDALSASALAGLDVNDCPVLITSGTSLSQQASDEIVRLGADKVYIAGGKAAVSEGVKGSIEALGVSTERLSGDNAVGTSLDIYEAGKGSWGTTCIVATNGGYWDALAASPFAYDQHAPIFLYNADTEKLDDSVVDAIRDGGFTRVIVCGGNTAVKDTVETQLKGLGSVTAVKRYGGKTAVETSALIAQACLDAGMHADGVAVATNDGYWDALTGAALCGKNGAPLVLASDGNRGAITGFVAGHKADITEAYVFGGTTAVSDATYDAVVAALK